MNNPSSPGVAAIASTSASPCAVSIMPRTRTVASASAGLGPIRRPDRVGPYERIPAGG